MKTNVYEQIRSRIPPYTVALARITWLSITSVFYRIVYGAVRCRTHFVYAACTAANDHNRQCRRLLIKAQLHWKQPRMEVSIKCLSKEPDNLHVPSIFIQPMLTIFTFRLDNPFFSRVHRFSNLNERKKEEILPHFDRSILESKFKKKEKKKKCLPCFDRTTFNDRSIFESKREKEKGKISYHVSITRRCWRIDRSILESKREKEKEKYLTAVRSMESQRSINFRI